VVNKEFIKKDGKNGGQGWEERVYDVVCKGGKFQGKSSKETGGSYGRKKIDPRPFTPKRIVPGAKDATGEGWSSKRRGEIKGKKKSRPMGSRGEQNIVTNVAFVMQYTNGNGVSHTKKVGHGERQADKATKIDRAGPLRGES